MADLTKTVSIIFEGEDRVTVTTDKIARTFQAVGTEASGAAAKVDQLDKEMDDLGKKAPAIASVSSALQALAASLVVKAFIDANVEAEKFTRTMTLLKGSSEAAAQEFAFVKDTANRLGLEIAVTAGAYSSLTAATNGTALQGESTRVIFEAVARAMAALGRSSEETGGAFLAITQIVSKGRVSLEELNGQLGERLPGALQIAARGLGITTTELIKLVETGGLTAEQFLPRFASELNRTFASATFDGYVASLARLKNSIGDAFLTIGDAGAFNILIKGVQGATAVITGSVASFVLLGEVAGALAAKLSLGKSFDFGAAVEASINKAANATRGANEALLGAESATKAVGDAGTAAGAKLASGLAGTAAQSADAWKKASGEIDKALKVLGIDPKTLIDPIIEVNSAFKDLTGNVAAVGDVIIVGLIGALQKLPQDASLDTLRQQIAYAFRDGKINAEEYAQALALIDTKQKGLSPSFGPVSDAARRQAEELAKTAKEAKKASEDLDKYRLELEKLASNERIKNIEAKVSLNIAQLQEDTKRAQAVFESLDNTVNSTGDLIGSLFGLFKDMDSLSFGAIRAIEDQIEKENQRRQEALNMQKKLVEAQIAQIRAQTQALEKGDSIIKVDGAGLKPHLEAFMWEILRTIQVRVNADGLKMLLGT
jgi:tape measure domain-containing protein